MASRASSRKSASLENFDGHTMGIRARMVTVGNMVMHIRRGSGDY